MRHSVRRINTAVRAMSETSVFIEEIAVSNTPLRLAALTRVLEAQGSRPVSPTDRQGLHPLLIPLAQTTSADSGEQTVTCLLRWPQPNLHKQMAMPVVTMVRNAQTVNLVARSVDEQLHRLLAEEDSRQQQAGPGPRSVAEAAGSDGEALYRQGDAEAAGFGAAGKLNLYLIRKVGMFPDVCEQLCFGHLSRNDTTSALVASEWYMRNGHFPGWARPYEFASEIFQRLEKRSEEARDMARVALRMPWWTLRGAFKEVQHVSCLNGSPEDVKYLLSEEAAAKASAQVTGMHHKEPRTPQEVALERASTLLDLVAAGARPSYDSVRDELSASYRSAGLTDVANFINAA